MLSLGDTDIDLDKPSLIMIWYCLVILVNIVMLNFVIAVVSETFSDAKGVHQQIHY